VSLRVLFPVALALASAACDDSKLNQLQQENEELRGEVDSLHQKLNDTRDAITDVRRGLRALKMPPESSIVA